MLTPPSKRSVHAPVILIGHGCVFTTKSCHAKINRSGADDGDCSRRTIFSSKQRLAAAVIGYEHCHDGAWSEFLGGVDLAHARLSAGHSGGSTRNRNLLHLPPSGRCSTRGRPLSGLLVIFSPIRNAVDLYRRHGRFSAAGQAVPVHRRSAGFSLGRMDALQRPSSRYLDYSNVRLFQRRMATAAIRSNPGNMGAFRTKRRISDIDTPGTGQYHCPIHTASYFGSGRHFSPICRTE